MAPVDEPLQVTSVFVRFKVIGNPGSVKVATAVPLQPFSSVTVTIYEPCARPVIADVEAPLLHR